MSILRAWIGRATVLFSAVGFLICAAGVVGVWLLRARVEAIDHAVFSAAQRSLGVLDAGVERVQHALDKSRQRVRQISPALERLRNTAVDTRRESEPLLQSLEEVYQQVKAAESWLDSSQAAVQGMAWVSDAVVSSQYAATHQESASMALAQRVRELSETIADVLARLQELRGKLIELRDRGQLVREVAVRIVARVADVDGRLANVSSRLEKFGAGLANTKAALSDHQQRLHRWIAIVCLATSLLLAWFGISQIAMLRHGWLRSRADDTSRRDRSPAAC